MLIKLAENGGYEIKVKLDGDAFEIGIREKPRRGPESLPPDFQLDTKILDEDSIVLHSLKKVTSSNHHQKFQTSIPFSGWMRQASHCTLNTWIR